MYYVNELGSLNIKRVKEKQIFFKKKKERILNSVNIYLPLSLS